MQMIALFRSEIPIMFLHLTEIQRRLHYRQQTQEHSQNTKLHNPQNPQNRRSAIASAYTKTSAIKQSVEEISPVISPSTTASPTSASSSLSSSPSLREESEVHFSCNDSFPILPVWHEGEWQLIRWGNPRGTIPGLPKTCWTWNQSIQNNAWSNWTTKRVEIPANLGMENGIWFRIRMGVEGLMVYPQEQQLPVVYMICEPSTRYYQVMTRSKRMPVLLQERI